MNRVKKRDLLRTDLAKELYGDNAGAAIKRNTECKVDESFSFIIEEAEIRSSADVSAYRKSKGKYITIASPKLLSLLSVKESLVLSKIISEELVNLCGSYESGVTVIGMGNREMTVDSLGVRCAEMIKPTRSHGGRGLSVVIPGVEASTGISALELVSSIIGSVNPSAAVAIDSLAARSSERLGRTVQLSDSGIMPGSGLGKRSIALNRETAGIPVLSIGVPTVISAKTLLSDVLDEGEIAGDDFFVGLVESDAVIEASARIIAVAIENAFS